MLEATDRLGVAAKTRAVQPPCQARSTVRGGLFFRGTVGSRVPAVSVLPAVSVILRLFCPPGSLREFFASRFYSFATLPFFSISRKRGSAQSKIESYTNDECLSMK